MKVEFKKGKFPHQHTISEGYATIVIENGVAEIDITDEAVVELVAKLGGRYAPPKEVPVGKKSEVNKHIRETKKVKRGKQ